MAPLLAVRAAGTAKNSTERKEGAGDAPKPLGKVANFFCLFVCLFANSSPGRSRSSPRPPSRPVPHSPMAGPSPGAPRGGAGPERRPQPRRCALPPAGQPGACSRPARPSRGRGSRPGGAAPPRSGAGSGAGSPGMGEPRGVAGTRRCAAICPCEKRQSIVFKVLNV